MNGQNTKIVFAGCARDCAPFLPAVLDNVRALSARMSGASFLFIENDSIDDTASQLAEFCRQQADAQLLLLGDVAKRIPQRTVRLAMARNTIISYLRRWPAAADSTLLLMLDMDGINARPWNIPVMMDAIGWMLAKQEVAGVFPNQLGHYYDMWALRHAQWCPQDAWEEVFDHTISNNVSDEAAFAATFQQRRFVLAPQEGPIEVASAFGGFGLYRLDAALRNPFPYCGEAVKTWGPANKPQIARWQRCEHVNFHLGLRAQGGQLFILPSLLNADTSGLDIPPDAFRSMLF